MTAMYLTCFVRGAGSQPVLAVLAAGLRTCMWGISTFARGAMFTPHASGNVSVLNGFTVVGVPGAGLEATGYLLNRRHTVFSLRCWWWCLPR